MNGVSGKTLDRHNATPKPVNKLGDKPFKNSFAAKSQPLCLSTIISETSIKDISDSEGIKSAFVFKDLKVQVPSRTNSIKPIESSSNSPSSPSPSVEAVDAYDLSSSFEPALSPVLPSTLSEESHEALSSSLQQLESIQWEHSSRSVASALGDMLTVVNDLSSQVEMSFDHEAPDSTVHMALKRSIQDELSEINEIFSEYVERHPSICHDEETAQTLFEQLQALGYDTTHHQRKTEQIQH